MALSLAPGGRGKGYDRKIAKELEESAELMIVSYM